MEGSMAGSVARMPSPSESMRTMGPGPHARSHRRSSSVTSAASMAGGRGSSSPCRGPNTSTATSIGGAPRRAAPVGRSAGAALRQLGRGAIPQGAHLPPSEKLTEQNLLKLTKQNEQTQPGHQHPQLRQFQATGECNQGGGGAVSEFGGARSVMSVASSIVVHEAKASGIQALRKLVLLDLREPNAFAEKRIVGGRIFRHKKTYAEQIGLHFFLHQYNGLLQLGGNIAHATTRISATMKCSQIVPKPTVSTTTVESRGILSLRCQRPGKYLGETCRRTKCIQCIKLLALVKYSFQKSYS
eukprot:GHVT01001682.1.p1 GENE.GHVT01001682.1~~GHVT01001682.1.p1  ORF type:complete len:299 (-),score=16.11 GHVT01001682.1:2069-2965(-)